MVYKLQMSAKQFALNHLTHLPHKNMIRTILRALVVVICHLPVFSSAATNVSIHAEWQTYTAPSGYTVGGFNLYQEDQLACQTQGATSTTVDCLVSLSADSTNFTLAAVFTNGTESPKSAPFTFVTPSGTETETPQQATSPPTAVISTSTAAGKAPLTVSFYAGGSSSSTGTTIASHVWNFGDNSSGTGVSPSHTYTAAGTYSATLTVTDSAGLKSSVGTPIVVTASAATGTTAPVPSTSTSTTRQLLWAQVGGGSLFGHLMAQIIEQVIKHTVLLAAGHRSASVRMKMAPGLFCGGMRRGLPLFGRLIAQIIT